jgi:hypothetical protein
MSRTCESPPRWRVCLLRPDLSCLPIAYRGTRQPTGIAVELQAASGSWFPLLPCPPDSRWPADTAGHRRLAFALATTRRLGDQVLGLEDDLLRHLQGRFQSDRWQLSAAQLESIIATAAWEESGAADLDQGDAGADW